MEGFIQNLRASGIKKFPLIKTDNLDKSPNFLDVSNWPALKSLFFLVIF